MKVKNLNGHIEHIVTGYNQQLGCYRRLLEIAQKMQSATGLDQAEFIALAVDKRAKLIGNIQEIEQNLATHKEAVMSLLHLKEFRLEKVQDLVNPELRDQLTVCRYLLKEVIELIIDADRKNNGILLKHIKDTSAELKTIQQHFEVQQAYLDKPESFPEPRFFDKKK